MNSETSVFLSVGFMALGIFFMIISSKFKGLIKDDPDNDDSKLKFAFYWLFYVNGWLFFYQVFCISIGFYAYDIGAVFFVSISLWPIVRYIWRG